MFAKLLLLFIIVPFFELLVILFLGKHLGFLNTLLTLIFFGLIGAVIAKQQGLSAIWKIREAWQQGIMPGEEMLNGILVLVGAVLLITPGLLTDFAAFFFLIPQTRRLLQGYLHRRLEKLFRADSVIHVYRKEEDRLK